MSRIVKKTVQTAPRVRIAPSPTGDLHIGTARTALFNWLFARHNNGKFILRIEDTDKTRSTKEFEKKIIEGLTWLGIDWDEGPGKESEFGPYHQMDRLELYKPYLERLLNSGQAYRCFCTTEELDKARKNNLAAGKPPVYSGGCCDLSEEEISKKKGQESIVRFRVPREEIIFKDIVRGELRFHGRDFGDFAIAKADDTPLFLLANVIDDALMKISHVVRGEEHLPNVPKQILLAKALGFETPQYAHIPLILNPDRSKMSKRAGNTKVADYRKAGYLPEAINNYIALLGWNPGTTQELFTEKGLIKAFELQNVNKAGAVFDNERLKWMNGMYIRKKTLKDLVTLTKDYWPKHISEYDADYREKILTTLQERLTHFAEIPELTKLYFEDPKVDASLLVWKKNTPEETLGSLKAVRYHLTKLTDKDFDSPESIENSLKTFTSKTERSVGEVFWPLRVALSGEKDSPGPQEILWVIGREKGIARIDHAINKF